VTRTGIYCDTRRVGGILKVADFRAWRSLRESNPCLRREQPKAFGTIGECHNQRIIRPVTDQSVNKGVTRMFDDIWLPNRLDARTYTNKPMTSAMATA